MTRYKITSPIVISCMIEGQPQEILVDPRSGSTLLTDGRVIWMDVKGYSLQSTTVVGAISMWEQIGAIEKVEEFEAVG